MKYRVVEEISGYPLIDQELSFEGDTTKSRRDAAEAECRRLNAMPEMIRLLQKVRGWCRNGWPGYAGLFFIEDLEKLMREIEP